MKRKLLFGIQIAVTLLLLTLLLRGFDWIAFTTLFARIPGWFYAVSLAVVLAGQVLYAWRWHVLLTAAGVPVSFTMALQQYFVGIFVNNFLPSTVGGDVAKVYYLGRAHGYRIVTASVVMDRFLGVALLAGLASIASWIVPPPGVAYEVVRGLLAAIVAVAAAIVIVVAVGSGGLPRRLAALGDRAVHLAGYLQRFRIALAVAIRIPGVWIKGTATVVAYFVLLTLTYQSFMRLQLGWTPGFAAVLLAVAAAAVLSNIPISMNGLGLREQLHVALLAPLGVPKEVAVAISLLLFAHLLVASLAGGLLWLRVPPAAAGVPELSPADSRGTIQAR